jgi:spore coat protein JA
LNKDQVKVYHPIAGNNDPCSPMTEKSYVLPPQLFFTYQPSELAQYDPMEALLKGTLWPDLYSNYNPKK